LEFGHGRLPLRAMAKAVQANQVGSSLVRSVDRGKVCLLEEHSRQISRRLGAPLFYEMPGSFGLKEPSAAAAAEWLGQGRSRLHKLCAGFLRAAPGGSTSEA
jgi:hypothetical protein